MTAEAPAHLRTYSDLRDRILFGQLMPGQPVTIQGLSADLNAGMTPVREAIRRLASEGALTIQDNRRVRIPRPDQRQIADLGLARSKLEPELASRAAACVDADALEEIEATQAAARAALDRGDLGAFLRANHRFHFLIYKAAGSDILTQVVDGLWLRLGPALRVMSEFWQAESGALGGDPAGMLAFHPEVIDALRRRDSADAARAMRRDVGRDMSLVSDALKRGAF